MRWIVGGGLMLSLLCQTSMPAADADVLSGAVGQGFLSGFGWGLCTVVGKGVMKAGQAIKGRTNKNNGAQTQNTQDMGPEDYYNRGLEDGYSRAQQESYGSNPNNYYGNGTNDYYSRGQEGSYSNGGEYNYASGQGGGYPGQMDDAYGTRANLSVHGRRIAQNRADYRQPTAARKRARRARLTHQGSKGTIAANQSNPPNHSIGSRSAHPSNNRLSHMDDSSRKKQNLASRTPLQ